MTEQIRSWPDALFYTSAASTANVREQLIKLQQGGKRLRALNDASTVNSNGDVFQDILTGLSFGNSTQRHKWRALYDTTNDYYLIQRNSGTDASKTWVEKFRIDSSGNVTVSGTQSTTGQITATGGIRMGGNLDMNQFYIRNLEKINGLARTDTLIVHDTSRLFGDVSLYRNASVAQNFYVAGTTELGGTTSVEGANVFEYTYASKTGADQAISALTLTDITELSGLTLPNTSKVNTRTFEVQFAVQLTDTSAAANQFSIRLYNGANGTKADDLVYVTQGSMAASQPATLPGLFHFTPSASTSTKFGLAVISIGTLNVNGTPFVGTVRVMEVTN